MKANQIVHQSIRLVRITVNTVDCIMAAPLTVNDSSGVISPAAAADPSGSLFDDISFLINQLLRLFMESRVCRGRQFIWGIKLKGRRASKGEEKKALCVGMHACM